MFNIKPFVMSRNKKSRKSCKKSKKMNKSKKKNIIELKIW